MDVITIKFSQTVSFLGRNGRFKAKGLDVVNAKDTVFLEPITSREKSGRAWVEIPKEDVPDLIAALNKSIKKLPIR